MRDQRKMLLSLFKKEDFFINLKDKVEFMSDDEINSLSGNKIRPWIKTQLKIHRNILNAEKIASKMPRHEVIFEKHSCYKYNGQPIEIGYKSTLDLNTDDMIFVNDDAIWVNLHSVMVKDLSFLNQCSSMGTVDINEYVKLVNTLLEEKYNAC